LRYFFHIGFNGHNYRGWQQQSKSVSVQQILEKVIGSVLKTPVTIMGCGRTDAQVNASQYFFHLDIMQPWDYDLMFRLNKALPPDIAIFDIIPVEENKHARFDAIQRTYDYFVHTYKDPFLQERSSFYFERNLDLNKMKEAVTLLPLYNDYRPFCITPDAYKTTICTVTMATLFADANGDRIRFQISANRFLGKMIRIIVGKLLKIGKGKLSVEEFESYLITKVTPKLIIPAHPQGLYLSKVVYPYLNIPPRTEFSVILQNNLDGWEVV
jgi:tRNA pseudouridine38-40 synthase